ncbi:hypothetical protein BJ508DRAFT_303433 [Ascobolus immersus RN42]|uniref:YCII-related domain-containing protein n=1 Tax=Ascobolus immersus RN42 TaxID=1160509 RepID=A0A3N4IST3_ASCIM|nr:hypothetical protein BJ508DRAFT_303433 [Ascobolus immersus RN42]
MGNLVSSRKASNGAASYYNFISVLMKDDANLLENVERVKEAGRFWGAGRIEDHGEVLLADNAKGHSLALFFSEDAGFSEIMEMMWAMPGVQTVHADAYVPVSKA